MRCVGRRRKEKEIRSGEMKRRMRHFQGRKMHTRRCVGIVLRRIRGGIKARGKKSVSKAMREKAEEALTELQNCSYGMLGLVKELKTDSKEVEGGRCMRGSDGKLCFSEKEIGKVRKDYMERIMNEKK